MTLLRLLMVGLFFSIVFVNQANSKNQERFTRNFWSPPYRSERLSYCSLDCKECGLAVANRYCKIMGYEKASEAIIEYNVGLTHFLFTQARCKGWQCNGFKLITCTAHFRRKPPQDYYYRSQRFVFPHFDHYRVDWCYENGRGCGHKAAYSFCRRMGYMRDESYEKEEHVAATKAIGNQRLCFGQVCSGFSKIDCYR